MKLVRFTALLVPVIFLANCTVTFLAGDFLASSRLPDRRLERLSPTPVHGESCQRLIFGRGWSEANFMLAIENALQSAPQGTRGLSDARFRVAVGPGGLFAKKCFLVDGIPARLR